MKYKTQKEALDRFFEDLDKCSCSPAFKSLFVRRNDDTGRLDLKKAKELYPNWSTGEKIMFSFFGNVFLGREEYPGFSLINAADRLDDINRLLVAKWLADPYYP